MPISLTHVERGFSADQKGMDLLPRMNWNVGRVEAYQENQNRGYQEGEIKKRNIATNGLIEIVKQPEKRLSDSLINSEEEEHKAFALNKSYKEMCRNKRLEYFKRIGQRLSGINDMI